MTGLLVKFGLVMIVVMLGFVMSFYSLFRDTQTFGEVREGKVTRQETSFEMFAQV